MRARTATKLLTSAALGAALIVPAIGQADPLPSNCIKVQSIIVCSTQVEAGSSGRFKTTTTTTKASFQSSHPILRFFTNPGGNRPPGQQP